FRCAELKYVNSFFARLKLNFLLLIKLYVKTITLEIVLKVQRLYIISILQLK
ncbi:hypothetical protein C0J52_13169, partial [Blattella germanica]